jgi:hypothetical protein
MLLHARAARAAHVARPSIVGDVLEGDVFDWCAPPVM